MFCQSWHPEGVTATQSLDIKEKCCMRGFRGGGHSSPYEHNATPNAMFFIQKYKASLQAQRRAHRGVTTVAITVGDSGLSAAHHSFVY